MYNNTYYAINTRDRPTVVSTDHHSDKMTTTTNSLIMTDISMNENA